MDEMFFGPQGIYHLLVTLPACAFWGVAIYLLWFRIEGWRLVWTRRDGWLRSRSVASGGHRRAR